MSLNLDKYRDSLVGAWRDVMNEKSPANWSIFGYDGHTFDLKLISSGANGIEEMNEDFSSGQIMYGLCRVRLEEKNVEKIALINWQGEGAPLARKGMAANHVSTIKNFFKGIHVTINARGDEDVDPELIIAAVAKATSSSGIRMSTSMESDVSAPVGTAYKRVNPQEEINSQAKSDFWLKEEKEEERRKQDEQARIHRFSRNEVQLLRKESQEYFNENDAHDEVFTPASVSPRPSTQMLNGSLNTLKTNGDAFNHVTSPRTISPASSGRSSGLFSPTAANNEGQSSASPIPAVTNQFIASEKAAALKASLPRKSANDNLVRQRVKSFDGNNFEKTYNSFTTNGGGKNGTDAESESLSVLRRKQMFENGGASSIKTPPRQSVSDEIKQLQQESLKAAAATRNKSPEPQRTTTTINNRDPSLQDEEPFDHQRQIVSPVRTKSPSPQPVQTQFPFQSKTATATHTVKAYNLPFHIGGSVTGKLAEKVNKNSENGVVGNGNHNHVEVGKLNRNQTAMEYGQSMDTKTSSSIEPPEHFKDKSSPSPSTNHILQSTMITTKSPSPTPVATISPTINSNESSSPSPRPPIDGNSTPTKSIEITPEMGLCARALYDYQAADDTEITFDPGEIITHIERIDEGWWEGLGPQGVYGLFPANYVELLN